VDTVEEADGRLEFRRHLSSAARALILMAGLLPWLAPYELLVEPGWRGEITAAWLPFLLLSAGAVAVSGLFACAALLGLSQSIGFDARSQLITHAYQAALLGHRVKRFPFSALEGLGVKTHRWTDGPDTHNLVAMLRGNREIEFGSFVERAEAERYRSALERLVRGGRPG
jgi:hypothetical protein